MKSVWTVLVLVVLVSPYAEAQVPPAPIEPAGVNFRVVKTEDGLRPKGAGLVVSRMKFDPYLGDFFPDLGTSVPFGICKDAETNNCVRADGTGFIERDRLPRAENQLDNFTLLYFRGVGDRHYHPVDPAEQDAQPMLVWIDNHGVTDIGPIWMKFRGSEAEGLYLHWITHRILSVGFWVRTSPAQDLVVKYDFSGTGKTTSEVSYWPEGFVDLFTADWTWVEWLFWTPEGVQNGAYCAQVQVHSPFDPEWAAAVTAKKCVPSPASPAFPLPPPPD